MAESPFFAWRRWPIADKNACGERIGGVSSLGGGTLCYGYY